MKLRLVVTAGPHQGKEFVFDGHDTFLVGRVSDAHLRLSYDDPYFSRRHFVIEVNPPLCRILDLKSRNGTRVNGRRIESAELRDGDEIAAGHTVFRVAVESDAEDLPRTVDLPRHLLPEAMDAGMPLPAIPGYEVEQELGRGGFGVVYRARRQADGQEVAIKTLLPSPGATRRQIERFLRECHILAQVQHAHIVGFERVGECGDLLYLVMEYVNGPDTGRMLKEQGPFAPRTAVRLLYQVLGGLAHAHDQGVVHRDIKPGNVLVQVGATHKKVAKLADFGLARAFESSKLSGLTLQGEIGGTPAFMAPEQVTHFREVKPAADQYSAAATLYTLLTGAYIHDFPLGVAGQLIHITTEEPVPILDRRPDLPPPLAKIIHRALAREPGDRYPDVRAFRAALGELA